MDDAVRDREGGKQGMNFSAAEFRKDKHFRGRLPKDHLAVLDGREVVEGVIEYEVDGEPWMLYPVLPEWCEAEEQST